MKHTPRYWRARITFRTPTGNQTAVKTVDAPDRETARKRAITYCRAAVRDNVVAVALSLILPHEVTC